MLFELDEVGGRYRVATIGGAEILPWKRMEDLRPIRWMIEVAGEHFPELAAAMRARAMREAMGRISAGAKGGCGDYEHPMRRTAAI